MGDDTRQRILDAGARLIHRQGYNATGIKQVLDECGVPKGSFYHYFKSKEDFGLAVVEHYESFFRAHVMELLVMGEEGPMERLRRFYDWFFLFFKENDFSLGCPVGNLAQELGDTSPVFQKRLEQSLQGMTRAISRVLAEAKGEGQLPDGLEPDETAMFMVEAWHGALVRMKTTKSGRPLEICHKMLFEKILGQ